MPECLISAITQSNRVRKDFIAGRVLEKARRITKKETGVRIGVYRLAMKSGSDNFRSSAVQGIIGRLRAMGASLVVYEPALRDGSVFLDSPVLNDLAKFKEEADVIIANRYDRALDDVAGKVYTRDLFGRD